MLGPISKVDFKNQSSTCGECHKKYELTMKSQYKFVYVDLQYQLEQLLSNDFIQQTLIEYIRHRNKKQNAADCTSIVTLTDVSDSDTVSKLIFKIFKWIGLPSYVQFQHRWYAYFQ